MKLQVVTYVGYLVLAVPLTIWVARVLQRNGKVFLVDCFGGNEELSESVNQLLVVGFYLVNLGFVSLYLRLGHQVGSVSEIFEMLSGKLGVVMLVLGAMHFMNVFVLNRMRRRGFTEKGGGMCRA